MVAGMSEIDCDDVIIKILYLTKIQIKIIPVSNQKSTMLNQILLGFY